MKAVRSAVDVTDPGRVSPLSARRLAELNENVLLDSLLESLVGQDRVVFAGDEVSDDGA